MNYKESIEFLSSLAVFGIRPGCERTRYAAELLGNPHLQYKTIHVAGTNGKGSTSTFISSILKEAGYNVGTYTSPYVFKVNERIQYNSENISDEDFAETFEEIKILNEKLVNTEYGSLTEFEAKTLGAFLYFARKKVDYAVIEVGMGGRFDATNIISPKVCLITSISLDHTEYLGDTIEKIAFEKAGIIKKNVPVISGACFKANKVIESIAKENNAPFISPKDYKIKDKGKTFDLKFTLPNSLIGFVKEKMAAENMEIIGDAEFSIHDLCPGLFGKYQFSNASISVIACKILGVSNKIIAKGIEKAYLPGRFERIEENLIIDGAHNIDGAKALKSNLELLNYNRLILVIGMLNNHSCEDFIKILAPSVNECIVTKSSFFRATPIDEIYKVAKKYIPEVYKENSVSDAVKKAKEIASDGDLILVTGSFYTIGEIKKS